MTYEDRLAQREMLQRKAIADATAVGFRNCHAVFDALGFDIVNDGGITRSSLQVAARWIVDAGFALESIVPDGYGSIPKAERTGCHVDDLPAIVAYKDAYYVNLKQREWDAAIDSAIAAQDVDGDGGLQNWTVYIESLGERPDVDETHLDAAHGRREAIEQAEQQADRARDVAIIAGMQSYDGPLNRRGRPRMRPLRQHLEEYDLGYITRAERNELWAKI